jgi:hypothetical protein
MHFVEDRAPNPPKFSQQSIPFMREELSKYTVLADSLVVAGFVPGGSLDHCSVVPFKARTEYSLKRALASWVSLTRKESLLACLNKVFASPLD